MLLAKTKRAAQVLSEQIHEKQLSKLYLAILCGVPSYFFNLNTLSTEGRIESFHSGESYKHMIELSDMKRIAAEGIQEGKHPHMITNFKIQGFSFIDQNH